MKNKFKLLFFSSFATLSIIIIGCSQTDEPSVYVEDTIAEQIYRTMSEIPTSSILSEGKSIHSRSSIDYEFTIPTFTQDDLNYLLSLSQSEFEEFRNNIIAQLGENGLDELEEKQDENYIQTFEILGGHAGMDNLKEFLTSYLETPGGWHYVQTLLPKNLNKSQTNIYIANAIYIDKISRPVYSALISTSTPSRGSTICDIEAGIRLALVGVDIGVDDLVDIMTDGAGAALEPLEGAAVAADLTSIWIDYEICNGRWH